MSKQSIPTFSVIGIEVRTTNENGQSAQDIPALWTKFMSEGIMEKIPNKTDPSIYCIYTDYESDHTKPYTTILGCKVEHLNDIPKGLRGITVNAANYEKRTVNGNLHQGLVFNEWLKIWESSLPRTFVTDFEIYGEKAANPEQAEVNIFVGCR
jgi:predicted transcriptional regulator YdeE